MSLKPLFTCLACAGILILFAAPAAADSSGLAGMHDWRKEGGKTCFTDHWHYGNGDGMKTKQAAINAAIVSWQNFTDVEYGSDWAVFKQAASKSVGCTTSTGVWNCQVEARPCRR